MSISPYGTSDCTSCVEGDTICVTGKSAYTVAVENGFVGTEAEWLASLVGPPGADGAPIDDDIPSTDGSASFVTRSAAKIAQLIAAALATTCRVALTRDALASTALLSIPVYLAEGKRKGWFFAEDYAPIATTVDADTDGGFYKRSTVDDTKVWVRSSDTVTPFDFGAAGDGVTDDLAALQAFSDWLFAAARPSVTADISGEFAIDASAGALLFGPAAANGEVAGSWSVRGHMRLVSLGAGFELCRLRNLTEQHIFGSFSAQGSGQDWFLQRDNGIGFVLENSGNMKVTGGFFVDRFWYQGVVAAIVNNDGAQLGKITARWCGSGKDGYSQTANYTGITNNGLAGASQRSTISGVDSFPDAAIETYSAIGDMHLLVRINGEVYFVYSVDRVAGTMDVFPIVDTALVGAGTLDWIYGGGFVTATSDGNTIVVDKLKAQNCGIGLGVTSLYGPRVNQANISSCGIGWLNGKKPNSACIGTSVDGLYLEGNSLDIGFLLSGGDTNYHYNLSGFETDLSKVVALNGVRNVASNVRYGALGNTVAGPTVTLAAHGRLLKYHGESVTLDTGPFEDFQDHREEPKTRTLFRDSQTVTLTVQGSGEYDRLFGYHGATWRYIGTGTDGAPTGTFTFTPPAGGTINGGAVNAAVSFSGFVGPAEFAIYHSDPEQLMWQVRCMAGQQPTIETGECELILADETGAQATMGPNNYFRYTKIGDLVTVSGTLNWTDTTALTAGSRLKVIGLPYAANATPAYRAAAVVGASSPGSFLISRTEIGFGVDQGNDFLWGTKITGNNDDGAMTKADIAAAGSLFGLQQVYQI